MAHIGAMASEFGEQTLQELADHFRKQRQRRDQAQAAQRSDAGERH